MKLPPWFRQKPLDNEGKKILNLLKGINVNTICVSGLCPNLNSCFKNKSLTFLILGDACSRHCRFCAVKKGGHFNSELLKDEPQRIRRVVEELGLDFVVITSVCRDDLPDKGVGYFTKTVQEIKGVSKDIKIELLIPDFGSDQVLLRKIVDTGVEVIAHNIEVPQPLYKEIKPQADYFFSLEVLRIIKKMNPNIVTKSSLMLGLGETYSQVISTIDDLRDTGLDILTLGQYLSPSVNHYPVKEFLSLEKFQLYREFALKRGIKVVSSGALVRSSYKAKELYYQVINQNILSFKN